MRKAVECGALASLAPSQVWAMQGVCGLKLQDA